MDRLKPCPFCGSSDVHITDAIPNYLYKITCFNCGIKVQPYIPDFTVNGMKMVAEAWNRRTEEGAQK